MSELLIHPGEWIVVCDGAKALVLENTGDTKFPNLKTVEVFEQKDLATHDLGTAQPGRAFSPAGHGARSSVEQTDWHDLAGIEYLLQRGADPNRMTVWRVTALHQALRRDNSLKIIESLLDHGADPAMPREDGSTAITTSKTNATGPSCPRRCGAMATQRACAPAPRSGSWTPRERRLRWA